MSQQANTRIFKGSILSVRNADNDAWIDTGEMISCSDIGAMLSEIPTSTAASTFDEFVLGLPGGQDATFNFFLNMDDEFQAAMETMRDGQETRSLKITIDEGTLNTLSFDAWVVGAPFAAAYNNVYTMTLTLRIVSAPTWSAV